MLAIVVPTIQSSSESFSDFRDFNRFRNKVHETLLISEFSYYFEIFQESVMDNNNERIFERY